MYHIRYYGLPLTKDGILEVQMKKEEKLNLSLYDHTLSIPEELIKQPIPAHVVPEQGRDSNITVVRKSYTF